MSTLREWLSSALSAVERRRVLSSLPVADRRRLLSEDFAREYPNAERSDHPGLVYRPGIVPAGFWCNPARALAFDRLGAAELDQIEAQIEREQTPPAPVVQLLAPAVPLHVQVLHADPYGRVPEPSSRPPVPVVALALRADGTVSALTELDVAAGGVVAERFPRSKVRTDAASSTPLAAPPSAAEPRNFAEGLGYTAEAHRSAQRSVAKLAPVKKAQAAK